MYMQPIKTSHGIAILGTCFLITLLFINWAGRQIDSYVLSVPISPSSQMAAISGSGSGLVAHYTFDDGTASDSSGNSNNGTVNGATAVVGKVGSGAMSFDGVDDIIEVTQSSSINDPLALTVSVWAKQSTLKTNGYYISKADNSSGGHGWSFGMVPILPRMFVCIKMAWKCHTLLKQMAVLLPRNLILQGILNSLVKAAQARPSLT